MNCTVRSLVLATAAILSLTPRTATAQSFGIELNNTMMPASGGMAGVSVARPQDLTSALNGNPATLTQFRGTQFIFGGGWAESTFNLTQTAPIIPPIGPPLIERFTGKSTAQGSALGNIGVTQDLSEQGLPVTIGLGFVTSSGAAADFRNVPASNGTNTAIAIFSIPMSVGIDLTDRLSVGATAALGLSYFDGPFVGVGGMTGDYALRGTLGANYQLTDETSVGCYYQTEQSFRYDNAFLLNPGPAQTAFDVNMQLPQNYGLGIANSSLMDGQLLLAADLLYKQWDSADLFKALYDNQLVLQFGTQYTTGRYKLRAGYAWAQNPVDQTPGPNLGGVVQPGGLPVVRYTQALLAVSNQNRISAGVGISDVLPGIDMDLMAGGMFRDTEQLGPSTTVSIASYWIGLGLTWRFGGCQSCQSPCVAGVSQE